MGSSSHSQLSVDFTLSVTSHIPDTTRVRELLSFAAACEGLQGQLGVWLCGDTEIGDLHFRFMNIPGATDVITFPSDPDVDGDYLGDIAVSTETAAVQAHEATHSPEREVAYLCLHGLLHLAGYDDLDEDSRETMIKRQDQLLNEFEQAFPGTW
jgi:probable rRNA maturation factor